MKISLKEEKGELEHYLTDAYADCDWAMGAAIGILVLGLPMVIFLFLTPDKDVFTICMACAILLFWMSIPCVVAKTARDKIKEVEQYRKLTKELLACMKEEKQTEGGRSEVCKTVEDYARSYAKDYAMQERSEERLDAIRNMIELGLTKEQILKKYSEEEYEKAEKELLVHA